MSSEKMPAELPRPKLLLSGLDSLYVSYFFDVSRAAIDFDELAFHKERIQEARQEQLAELQLGTEKFAILPFGKHPYRYVLTNDAFEVRLTEHLSPSCHVRFSSQGLWQCGLNDLLRRFDSWRESTKLKPFVPEVVSRADLSFDYDLPAMDFTADDFVGRAHDDAIYRRHRIVQTIKRGSGDVVVRVYNKVAEIEEESGKFWFYDLWGQDRNVWRIEFQMRRDRLRKAGIGSIAELQDLQSDVLRELAQSHTTLRRSNGDTNKSRWPLHPLWRALTDDIAALPQTGLIQSLDPKAHLDTRIYHQLRALHGNLKGLAAVIGEHEERRLPITLPELLNQLPEKLKQHHNEVVWHADVSRRLKALRLGQW